MIVALDANCLVAWSSQRAADRIDQARLEHLLDKVASAGGKLIIATPALAEFLVGIDEAASDWINVLDRKRSVFVAPFDRRCAFECSLLDKAALGKGDKKGGRKDAWQRIKIDRQIVAVARLNQVTLIVTNDVGLRATATAAGIPLHALTNCHCQIQHVSSRCYPTQCRTTRRNDPSTQRCEDRSIRETNTPISSAPTWSLT